MTTDWSKLWERYVLVDGKEVPIDEYRRQEAYEKLSPPAKHLLWWLTNRKKKSYAISLVEITKCLTPVELRKSAIIRKLMSELASGGFAESNTRRVYYSGVWRQEAWHMGKATMPLRHAPLPSQSKGD